MADQADLLVTAEEGCRIDKKEHVKREKHQAVTEVLCKAKLNILS